jgi:hypothetical protein
MSITSLPAGPSTPVVTPHRPPPPAPVDLRATAVVYCEANLGGIDGKTANGLVRHSERYEILSVIDSEKVGLDAGEVLDGVPNAVPVCRDLADAVARAGVVPDWFIFGMAPSSGMLSTHERGVVLEAIGLGMGIVNGLHEFLDDDPELAAAAELHGVEIRDVRRPRAKKDLRMFSGRIEEVTCPRIAVLGTDGAIGKRTTATILTRALNDRGIRAVMVGTGQTGLIQGARYGIALDSASAAWCDCPSSAGRGAAVSTRPPWCASWRRSSGAAGSATPSGSARAAPGAARVGDQTSTSGSAPRRRPVAAPTRWRSAGRATFIRSRRCPTWPR